MLRHADCKRWHWWRWFGCSLCRSLWIEQYGKDVARERARVKALALAHGERVCATGVARRPVDLRVSLPPRAFYSYPAEEHAEPPRSPSYSDDDSLPLMAAVIETVIESSPGYDQPDTSSIDTGSSDTGGGFDGGNGGDFGGGNGGDFGGGGASGEW